MSESDVMEIKMVLSMIASFWPLLRYPQHHLIWLNGWSSHPRLAGNRGTSWNWTTCRCRVRNDCARCAISTARTTCTRPVSTSPSLRWNNARRAARRTWSKPTSLQVGPTVSYFPHSHFDFAAHYFLCRFHRRSIYLIFLIMFGFLLSDL